MITTNWFYKDDVGTTVSSDVLKYATIQADDTPWTKLSNLVSTCGVSFDEAAEAVLKLQESMKNLSERVVENECSHYRLNNNMATVSSKIECSSNRIDDLQEAVQKLENQIKELQNQLRPGTSEKTVKPKQKSDLEIFCRDVLNMEFPNFDQYFTLIDFS